MWWRLLLHTSRLPRDVIEQDSSGKFLLGDVTTQKIKHAFNDNLASGLKSIASDTKADTTSWIVNSWTAKDKGAADAEFARLMNAQSPIDKHQLDGIDSVPELRLEPWDNHKLLQGPGFIGVARCMEQGISTCGLDFKASATDLAAQTRFSLLL